MNEARATLLLIASPFVWVARTYVSGAKNLVSMIRREPEPERIVKVRRIARNYVQADVTRARQLLAITRHYIRVLRDVGLSDDDEYVIGWLHALPLSLASQSFGDLYDSMLADSRITDDERDLIATAVLDAQAAEVALL